MLDGFTLLDNGIPIYVQLREQIRGAIARGLLMPGTQLPTMRQVAVQLKIDLNTVQRAYAELEREGVLTTMRGRGSFVAAPAASLDNRDSRTDELARKVAAEAGVQGVALEALAAALTRLAGA
jgi:GntR family transcriptional regulator